MGFGQRLITGKSYYAPLARRTMVTASEAIRINNKGMLKSAIIQNRRCSDTNSLLALIDQCKNLGRTELIPTIEDFLI